MVIEKSASEILAGFGLGLGVYGNVNSLGKDVKMLNIDTRWQTRKDMTESLKNNSAVAILFEIKIAIMQAEILDEYLKEKIRSDKVIEGLLKDIRAEIERAGEKVLISL